MLQLHRRGLRNKNNLMNRSRSVFKWWKVYFNKPIDNFLSSSFIYYNEPRFESMSFVVNILACKLKIVNNRN